MVKITLIGTLPPLKGPSDYGIELVKTLSKSNKIDFISFKKLYPEFLYPDGTKDKDKEFKIDKNKNLKVKNIITYYNPISWLKAGLSAEGKIVHMQWWTFYLAPIFLLILLILKLRNKKIVLTVHNVLSHESNFFDKLLTKMIFLFPNVFLLHSNRNIEKMRRIFKIPRKKMIKVPHGIYTFYKNFIISKKEARNKLNFSKNSKIILCFGNIRKYKGIDVMLKAFNLVNKKIKNSILVIAGSCWINWKPYEDLINKFNLKEKVKLFLNYVPMSKVKHYFSATDLVVLSHKNFEAQSGAGTVALSYNKPLIVSNVGGLPDLVKDKNCVFQPNNYKELANKIIKLFNNKKLLNKLSKDSENLSKEYSWDNVGKKLIKIYQSLVN